MATNSRSGSPGPPRLPARTPRPRRRHRDPCRRPVVMIVLPNATGLVEYPHGFAASLDAGTSGSAPLLLPDATVEAVHQPAGAHGNQPIAGDQWRRPRRRAKPFAARFVEWGGVLRLPSRLAGGSRPSRRPHRRRHRGRACRASDRSLTIAENPSPSGRRQSCAGPPAGHDAARAASVTKFRCGPPHCGQVAAAATAVGAAQAGRRDSCPPRTLNSACVQRRR